MLNERDRLFGGKGSQVMKNSTCIMGINSGLVESVEKKKEHPFQKITLNKKERRGTSLSMNIVTPSVSFLRVFVHKSNKENAHLFVYVANS